MSIIPGFGHYRQDNQEFKVSLVFVSKTKAHKNMDNYFVSIQNNNCKAEDMAQQNISLTKFKVLGLFPKDTQNK